jgi:hypothetical protein
VAEPAGSRIAQATGGAGERGNRFCRAQHKVRALARSSRGKIGGQPLVLVRGLLRRGTLGSLRREKEGEGVPGPALGTITRKGGDALHGSVPVQRG